VSTIVKPNLREVLSAKTKIYREANKAGMTLSAWLDREYPEVQKETGLDAFETLLKEQGIIVQSIPSKGIWADKVEKFFVTEESSTLFPEYVNRTAREALQDQSILDELVGLRTSIDSGSYSTVRIDINEDDVQKKRVVEGSELPEATITSTDANIKLRKYGRQVKVSYEAARRTRIDKFALCIKAIMNQANLDRATAAYLTLINGDGNTGTAATVKKINADYGGTKGTVDYKSWMKFRFGLYPHTLTTVVGNSDALVAFLSMEAPEIDPLKLIEQLRFGKTTEEGTMVQPVFGDYRIVLLEKATNNYLLGLDKRFALEMVTEIGADLAEVDKLVTTQWNVIALSEVNGFGIVLPKAKLVLDINN
jgi:hypothetical protein